jgi:hypothetical protein
LTEGQLNLVIRGRLEIVREMISSLLLSLLTPDEKDLDPELLPPAGADKLGYIHFFQCMLEEDFKKDCVAALNEHCPPEVAADAATHRSWTEGSERLAELVTIRSVGAVMGAFWDQWPPAVGPVRSSLMALLGEDSEVSWLVESFTKNRSGTG